MGMAVILLAFVPAAATLTGIRTIDLFNQLDARLPHGFYRIPSLVATPSGTLLAFVLGRFHRTDSTPNIVYLRRSFDDGATWDAARPIMSDPTNHTEFSGAPIVDPIDGSITYVHNKQNFSAAPQSVCHLWSMRSVDEGATWSKSTPLSVPNKTWGGALASGITLTRGPHKGRMMVALNAMCQTHASYVLYSDDRGATWQSGAHMVLLPKFGGGWTECQVAELRNGSVLLTSRNRYAISSGQGPRLFARSDDGGVSWAANWSANYTTNVLPDPYCEASLLSDPTRNGTLVFGNPSAHKRYNFSVHASDDGGRTWPRSTIVYPGDAAYSDMAFTRNGSVAVLFEKGGGGFPYASIAFGVLPVP